MADPRVTTQSGLHPIDPDGVEGGRKSRASIADGERVGKYLLVRRLGEGGMAEVWVARDETLEVDVAIKFIRADLEHPQLDDRLLQEARAAARLGHPAIVRVHDYGKTDMGDPFIAMELLAGESLALVIERRGRLPAVRAVRTLLPIAHALATAHDKGIVHRDLKPENIILTPGDGLIQPKLLDFGIAKLERAEARITRAGSALGSPGYMSPEQARGHDVDLRTDVWSFCVLLYELITGRLPFDAKSYNALLRSIIEDTPPPIRNFAAGDDALWAILERGFNKDPDLRWQSMRALGSALAGWLQNQGVSEDVAGASLQATWVQRTTDEGGPGATLSPPRTGLAHSSSNATVAAPATLPAEPASRTRLVVGLGVGAVLLTGLVFVLTMRGGKEPAPSGSAGPSPSAGAPPVVAVAPTPERVEPVPSTLPSASASSSAVRAPNKPVGKAPPGPSAAAPKPDTKKPAGDGFELKTPY